MLQSYRALMASPPGLMRRSLRAVVATFPDIVLIGEADGCVPCKNLDGTDYAHLETGSDRFLRPFSASDS